MMKVCIVTCFESNEERVSFVYDACKKRGYKTKVFTTDFSHIKKQKRNNVPKGFDVVETKPYGRNLSVGRMVSHSKFAKDVFKKVEEFEPDLIWLMAPANSLIKQASIYKDKHLDTKIIIDIIDMWPESLPINVNKNIFPFSIWKNIRKDYINCADSLVTECDYYKDTLYKEYSNNIHTILWARDSKAIAKKNKVEKDKLVLCYIGSINNIIGTEIIRKIIKRCNMPVVLHVIGEGENRYNFVNVLNRVCEVEYHGAIRDEKKKEEIMSMCHAGINIYKDNLYIGLTVKCIDYFKYGLPIINNIKGDTWKMVDRFKVGVNINEDCLIDANKIIKMKNNNKSIYKFYNDNFTKEVFVKNCLKVIDGVIK